MIECSVQNVTKYYGAEKLFENISFEIKTGERVGLIGANGSGKTTLLKCVMRSEEIQQGEIFIRKGSKVGYLHQVPWYPDSMKTIDVIRLAFDELYQMKQRLIQLEQMMENDVEIDRAIKEYGKLTEVYEQKGGYDAEVQLDKVVNGLGINCELLEQPFDRLSGGEKTRIMLAKILLEEPDLLLLDEPSNHLDLKSVDWLEGYLKEYKGSVLVVSHDRYFLDRVVGKIIEISKTQADVYFGNYSYYVLEKERRFLVAMKHYENQQKKIDNMERQIERYRIWGTMRDSEKMFVRAKELEKRLEKIQKLEKPIFAQRKVDFAIEKKSRTGRRVLTVSDLTKAYGGKQLFDKLEFTLFYQDRLCILGQNGCGKTTLLKIFTEEIQADNGRYQWGSNVKIGYLPQDIKYEDEEQTVLTYFASQYNLSNGEARSKLAKALFLNEDVYKKIKSLSGGEKSRLKLCSLTYQGVNVLILDEPTNHLDIESREELEESLCDFTGTILFVSHDRYFIDKVADRVLELI